jgi:hypothetical protein
MTDFGLAVAKTQQAAGNQPQIIQNRAGKFAAMHVMAGFPVKFSAKDFLSLFRI